MDAKGSIIESRFLFRALSPLSRLFPLLVSLLLSLLIHLLILSSFSISFGIFWHFLWYFFPTFAQHCINFQLVFHCMRISCLSEPSAARFDPWNLPDPTFLTDLSSSSLRLLSVSSIHECIQVKIDVILKEKRIVQRFNHIKYTQNRCSER